MIKFKDYKYERPDFEAMEEDFKNLLEKFRKASSLEEQLSLIEDINKLRNNYYSMYSLVFIRYSINTKDSFYQEENSFLDENMPRYEKMRSDFYRELVQSKYRQGLEEKLGSQLFDLAQLQLESFSEEIMEDLVRENKLSSEYDRLIASADIEFQGSKRNLSQLLPFLQSEDRQLRKEAWNKYFGFFAENQDEFDRIYDQLVRVRHEMALKLGYENYVDFGYKRMGRTDYNAAMVKNYRRQVLEDLVPFVGEILERKRERLGLKDLKHYDEYLEYLTGNPVPKGDANWILENGRKMYSSLSKETGEFFDFMLERELLDLVSSEGKMAGGYCTIIPDYNSPFIFSNFNGTSDDIDVLTHEAGHAFQVYMTLENYNFEEYSFPTKEACEIHSMSMEFLTWPWMELFFEEDLDKYKFSHLSEAISFIPYGVAVDEFQHFVYENPNISPEERRRAWRDIEEKYLPFRDYDGNDFLNKGGFWFKQGHIFSSPFYYIDYTLAQVCAFQFLLRSLKDRTTAWEDYLRICRVGGSISFLEIVKLASLNNPFEDGSIKSITKDLRKILDSFDDKSF